MVSLPLELILNPLVDASPEVIDLSISVHIHKRLEHFRYLKFISDDSIPIEYLGNPSLNSHRNLLIVDKSHMVSANSARLFDSSTKHDVFVGGSYSSPYSKILFSNKTFTDRRGKQKPLFFRHILPENTTEVSLIERRGGNKKILSEGYLIDLETRSIYTNYQNVFDDKTQTYRLFFVTGSTSDGSSFRALLNSQPIVNEASWEDIDLDTGMLTDQYPLYTVAKNGSGYTYSLNSAERWYVRAYDKGLIHSRKPKNTSTKRPWFLRITQGDVSGYVNSSVRRYWLPDFYQQSFIPYSPVKYGVSETLLFVNRRVLAATRDSLKIEPDKGFHLEIRVYDESGVLIHIYTTDQSLSGERYSADLFYETDKISSWDNRRGFIELSVNQLPGYTYEAKYYYEADDYEYTRVNLNPISNRKMKDHMYVFYVIPSANESDRAVHHLVVNSDGVIVDASQSAGLTYPNLTLENVDGSYNPSTVIGMKYFSEVENSFLDMYAAGFANNNAYLIVAEVTAFDSSVVENQVEVDVRREGAVIKPAHYTDAFTANPKAQQSVLGYGEQGQVVPQVNVMVLRPHMNILEGYGGHLTQERAEALLRAHMPAHGYAVIQWNYPKAEISVTSYEFGEAEVSLTWEGFFDYKIYRRATDGDVWTLVYETDGSSEEDIVWTDVSVQSGLVYQYAASLSVGDVEYPKTESYVLMIK